MYDIKLRIYQWTAFWTLFQLALSLHQAEDVIKSHWVFYYIVIIIYVNTSEICISYSWWLVLTIDQSIQLPISYIVYNFSLWCISSSQQCPSSRRIRELHSQLTLLGYWLAALPDTYINKITIWGCKTMLYNFLLICLQ